jgi:hypothetical protein
MDENPYNSPIASNSHGFLSPTGDLSNHRKSLCSRRRRMRYPQVAYRRRSDLQAHGQLVISHTAPLLKEERKLRRITLAADALHQASSLGLAPAPLSPPTITQ